MKKEITLYKFNELEKDIQKKLIEKEKEYQLDSYCDFCLKDDMTYCASELLIKYFKIDTIDNVYYDLSYSQGSGSMIEFDINIKDLNNKYHILNEEEMRYIQDKGIINNIEIRHNNSNYYHEYTFSFNYYDNFGYWDYEDIKDDYNINKEDFDTIEDRILGLLDDYNKHNTDSKFIEDIVNMNRELTQYGYSILEDEKMFEEMAIESIEQDDLLYFKNGDVYIYD